MLRTLAGSMLVVMSWGVSAGPLGDLLNGLGKTLNYPPPGESVPGDVAAKPAPVLERFSEAEKSIVDVIKIQAYQSPLFSDLHCEMIMADYDASVEALAAANNFGSLAANAEKAAIKEAQCATTSLTTPEKAMGIRSRTLRIWAFMVGEKLAYQILGARSAGWDWKSAKMQKVLERALTLLTFANNQGINDAGGMVDTLKKVAAEM